MVKVHFYRDMCICPASLRLGTPPPAIEASGALWRWVKRKRERNMSSFYEEPRTLARAALEFWVERHDYLKKMKLPTYKVENVTAGSIFRMSQLEDVFRETVDGGCIETKTTYR